MAGFFEAFFNIDGEYNEAHVRCPFPHSSDEKGDHFDSIASASVNIEKDCFIVVAVVVAIQKYSSYSNY